MFVCFCHRLNSYVLIEYRNFQCPYIRSSKWLNTLLFCILSISNTNSIKHSHLGSPCSSKNLPCLIRVWTWLRPKLFYQGFYICDCQATLLNISVCGNSLESQTPKKICSPHVVNFSFCNIHKDCECIFNSNQSKDSSKKNLKNAYTKQCVFIMLP